MENRYISVQGKRINMDQVRYYESTKKTIKFYTGITIANPANGYLASAPIVITFDTEDELINIVTRLDNSFVDLNLDNVPIGNTNKKGEF